MQYTEYKAISLRFSHGAEIGDRPGLNRVPGHETVLNDLGRNGWELVSVTHVPDAEPADGGANLMIFRRPLRDA